jgi:O-Antigen ligase
MQNEAGGAQSDRRRRLEDAAWILVMLLPGALTVFLGFHSGGFYVGATSLVATEMALVVGLRFALARRPVQGVSPPLLIAVVAIGCFAAWTLLSSDWSDAASRALPEYSRALLYGLTLLFFGMLPFNVRRIRWLVYGVAAAALVLCAAALTARLLPHVIFDPTLVTEHRLGYPLTYWNALGIIACVGLVLCAHLACSTRDAPLARVLGAGSVPVFALTLVYTLSRGGIWAAAGALVVYVAIGRPRALLNGAVAIVPPTLIAVLAATPSGPVTDSYPSGTVGPGEHVAWVLLGCMAAAAVLRSSLLPVDNWLARVRLPGQARRIALGGGLAAAVVTILVAAAAFNAPHVVATKYREFTDRSNTSPGTYGASRLVSARPEDRFDLWHVALDAYRQDPLRGSGAGTYVLRWNRERPDTHQVQNAHSLYLEVLGELGVVGLALLLTTLALILAAFAYRARGPDRALFAALLACGLAWAVHAGVDWDWQMPAVSLWLFALGGAALTRSLRRRRRDPQRENRNLVLRFGGVAACLLIALLPAKIALSQARLNSAIEAMGEGDCQRARQDARDSLALVSKRPAPYTVIAYCELREGNFHAAAAAERQALRRDPLNWELHYMLAISRAGEGRDPRAAIRSAARLNPNSDFTRRGLHVLADSRAASWRSEAVEMPLLPPESDDP